MVKKTFLLGAVLLLLFVSAGCAKPAVNTAINAAVSGNAVTIQGFAFTPQVLEVKIGTTVTWTNNDTVLHVVKSSLFESPQLSQGQTFQYTFNQAGTYDYNCSIHPMMKGQIIVQQ